MADGDEEAFDVDLGDFIGLEVFDLDGFELFIADDIGDDGVPEHFGLGVFQDAFLHDLAGAQFAAAVDDVDLAGDLGMDPNLIVTAKEAAGAMEILARNGLSAEEIMQGAAEGSILLANAVGTDFKTAADIATDAMAMFDIPADQFMSAVDGIVGVVENSKFSIQDFRLALANGGGTARLAGVEFDEFLAIVANTAPTFRSGMTSGTAFKTMMLNLVPTSKASTDAMRELGLITFSNERAMNILRTNGIEPLSGATGDLMTQLYDLAVAQGEVDLASDDAAEQFQDFLSGFDLAQNVFFDAEGQMKSLGEVIGILEDTMGGLTEEDRLEKLRKIFGTEGIQMVAAAGLFGGEGYDEMVALLEGTDAVAAAAVRMGTMRGVLEVLSGIGEQFMIDFGTPFLKWLQGLGRAVAVDLEGRLQDMQPTLDKLAEIMRHMPTLGDDSTTAFLKLVGVFGKLNRLFGDNVPLIGTIHEILKGAMGDVLGGGDVFGAVWDSLFASLPEGTQDAITAVQGFFSWVVENKDGIAGAFAGIGAVLAGGLAFAALAGALAFLVSPMGILIALGAAIGAIWATDFWGIKSAVLEAVGGIKDFISTIDSADSVGEFVGNIATAFVDYDWASVGLSMLEALGIKDDAFNFVGGIQSAIGDKVEELMKVPVIGMMVKAFQNLQSTVSDVQSQVRKGLARMGAYFGAFFKRNQDTFAKIGGGLAGLGMALASAVAVIKRVLVGAWRFLAPILEALRVLVVGVFGAIINAITGNWEGAGEELKIMWEQIKLIFVDVWQGILDWLREDFSFNLLGIIETALEWLAEKFTNWWSNRVGEWDFIVAIKDGIAGLGPMIREDWNRFVDWISSAVEEIGVVVDGWTASIRTSVGGFGQWLADWFGRMKEQYITLWVMQWETIKVIAQAAWDWIKSTVAGFIQGLADSWAGMKLGAVLVWTKLKNLLVALVGRMKDAITERVAAIVQRMRDDWNEAKENISKAWNSIRVTILVALIRIKTVIKEKFTEAKEWIEGLWLDIIDWFKNDVRTWFQEAGTAIVEGFKQGLRDAWNGVTDAVRNGMRETQDAADEENERHSPSRVYERMGHSVAQGFALGLSTLSSEASGVLTSEFGEILGFAGTFASTMQENIIAAFGFDRANAADVLDAAAYLNDESVDLSRRLESAKHAMMSLGVDFIDENGNIRSLETITQLIADTKGKLGGVGFTLGDAASAIMSGNGGGLLSLLSNARTLPDSTISTGYNDYGYSSGGGGQDSGTYSAQSGGGVTVNVQVNDTAAMDLLIRYLRALDPDLALGDV